MARVVAPRRSGGSPKRSRQPASSAEPSRSKGRFSATAFAAASLVVAVALAAYANSLGNSFVWDDPIILSRQLVVFDSVRDVLLTPRNIPQYSPDYYRPLTVASFLLDRALGGSDPFVYHLSVVIAHMGVSLLVLCLGWVLFGAHPGGRVAAVTAATLFAAHPIHTESVAWIAGRSDVLATAFVLAAIVAHRRLLPTWRRAAAVGAFCLLALGAKETAISVVPLLMLSDVLRSDGEVGDRAVWWPGYAGVAVAGATYVLLRRAALGDLVGHAATGSPIDRSLADLVGAVGAYLLKLVWPINLNAYIDSVPTGPALLLLTMTVLAALVAVAFWAWRAGYGSVTFLVLWLLLSLAPSLAIVWKIPEAPMAERYLYLPSVAFCLLCGFAVSLVWKRASSAALQGALVSAVVAVIVAATVATWARNRVWHDDLALWSDTAAKSRIAGLPLRSVGVAYQQRGQPEQARQYLEEALQRRNSPAGLQAIYNNLGTLAMQAQRYDEARRHYEAALQAYPNAADTLFNLGLSIFQGGGGGRDAATAALDYFQRAEQLSPHDADIQAALGQVAALRGDRERAIVYLRRALELGPSPAVTANIRSFLETLEHGGTAESGKQ